MLGPGFRPPPLLEIERGPEYHLARGVFALEEGVPAEVNARLERLAELGAEGWWSGESPVHRRAEEIESLMRTTDPHVAEVITWWRCRGWRKFATD